MRQRFSRKYTYIRIGAARNKKIHKNTREKGKKKEEGTNYITMLDSPYRRKHLLNTCLTRNILLLLR